MKKNSFIARAIVIQQAECKCKHNIDSHFMEMFSFPDNNQINNPFNFRR